MKTGNKTEKVGGGNLEGGQQNIVAQRAGEDRRKEMSKELKENERMRREEMEGDRGDRRVI